MPAFATALVVFAFTAAIFLLTMSRTYGSIDKGELAAVAATLGIAHPTGYPTLTLLGYLATRLVPARPVLVLNALSALWSAAGAGLLTLVVLEVVNPLAKRLPRGPVAALSALAVAFVALSTTWWSQATGFEVYSLHALVVPLTVLTFFHYLEDLDTRQGRSRWSRSSLVFGLCLGLSFTNHLSTVMLIPAFSYLFLRATGFTCRALREALFLVPGVLAGLLPYAYLPIRASMHPRLDWGDPDTVDRLLEHVSGAQFHFAVAFIPRVFRQQSAFFLHTLASDLSLVGLALAALGFCVLFWRQRMHALWTGILFSTCGVISGLYDINDIGNYYLPAFLALAVWVGSGLTFLAERVGRRTALAVGFLLLGWNATRHFPEMNERENRLTEDLTRNVLASLPPRAVVFSNHWDYWVSGSLYAQEVDGFRQDVLVLDPEALRTEPFLAALERLHPDLIDPIQSEMDAFVLRVREFQRDPDLTAARAEAYYSAYYRMIQALIERNPGRLFFVTEWTDPRIGERYHRVPTQLAYLLTEDESYHPQPFPRYRFRPWRNRVDPYAIKVSEIYTASLLARARYEEEHGRPEEGHRYGLYALSFDPGFTEQDVPDFPLHIEDQIREVLRNYAQLRNRVRGDPGR